MIRWWPTDFAISVGGVDDPRITNGRSGCLAPLRRRVGTSIRWPWWGICITTDSVWIRITTRRIDGLQMGVDRKSNWALSIMALGYQDQALQYILQAAEQGYSKARHTLGEFFFERTSWLKNNLTYSLRWYKRGAEQGHTKAIQHVATHGPSEKEESGSRCNSNKHRGGDNKIRSRFSRWSIIRKKKDTACENPKDDLEESSDDSDSFQGGIPKAIY